MCKKQFTWPSRYNLMQCDAVKYAGIRSRRVACRQAVRRRFKLSSTAHVSGKKLHMKATYRWPCLGALPGIQLVFWWNCYDWFACGGCMHSVAQDYQVYSQPFGYITLRTLKNSAAIKTMDKRSVKASGPLCKMYAFSNMIIVIRIVYSERMKYYTHLTVCLSKRCSVKL